MAHFQVSPAGLALVFSPLETLGGLRRGARVALGDIASVEVVADPWLIVSGMRVGTGLPWVILLGTMLRAGANDVVAIYGNKPAVVVHLRPGARWQRLIATVPNPDMVADVVRRSATHLER